ncbi:FMN-dependent NADH-azoreductase [Streptomyces sp. NPDC059063]|uniref:FMN-dependent NADH-azoreductase n=1 Tax=unclassified Streptomyces TaxID=2593676 RepID=UPI0036BBEC8B
MIDNERTTDVPTLLHLDSSADGAGITRRLGALYAEGWRARHGDAGYRYRDLAAEPVPLVGQAYVRLGTRVERQGVIPMEKVAAQTESAEEEREWAATLPLIEELRAADTLLVGAPMYNFSVTTALKAWIDRVTFPGAYLDPDSGRSLLAGTRVMVAAACGGGYGPGTPREGCDFHLPYLRAYFTNLGVAQENLHVVRAELTRAGDIPALAPYQEIGARSREAAWEAITGLTRGISG